MEEADVKLTWADIGIFIENTIDEYENEEKFVLLNFINYLKEQGLWIDVLNGKYTNEEQLNALKDTIVEGINILTNIKLS
ncbi:MAG: hypothetical protein ACRCXT_00975 [Paraclostridium sp.]